MPTLRLHGRVREVAGVDSIEVDVSTVGGLIAEADVRFGNEFVRARSAADIRLNGEPVDGLATQIKRKDEVELLPQEAEPAAKAPVAAKAAQRPPAASKPTTTTPATAAAKTGGAGGGASASASAAKTTRARTTGTKGKSAKQ